MERPDSADLVPEEPLGKSVRMDVYEHGYHDPVLGPQGQDREDLPRGEVLLQGALDALELKVSFVRDDSPGAP